MCGQQWWTATPAAGAAPGSQQVVSRAGGDRWKQRTDVGIATARTRRRWDAIFRNIGLRGGVAPARHYIPELLDDVLASRINPGLVLDYETSLDDIDDAYTAMLHRRATKALFRISA
jgi:threonine dehydrogenase-like Zn-dependent dehydrogenase